MTYSNRRPPYSKRLAAMLERSNDWPGYVGTSSDGRHVSIWLLFGPGCWGWAHVWKDQPRLFVVCPPGEDPSGYDWRLLRGHDPILVEPVGECPGKR